MRRAAFAAVLALPLTAYAQAQDFSKVAIKTTPVAPNLWMLEGAGGNLAVRAGPDGILVVDDQFAPLAPKIQAAIAALSKQPLRFLVNTHWHGDHVGGNEAMAGAGALIVAQDNVRRRMSTEQVVALLNRKIPPSPLKALPVITFGADATFHLNGEEIHVVHLPAAHTDGDAAVHFVKANALHAGDVFVNGTYPLIDYSSGGTIDGLLTAQDRLLALIDDKTKIIPGHGPLADKAALRASHDMTAQVRDRVAALASQGKKLEEIQAAKPLADLDATWGKGMVKADLLVDMVFRTLPAPNR